MTARTRANSPTIARAAVRARPRAEARDRPGVRGGVRGRLVVWESSRGDMPTMLPRPLRSSAAATRRDPPQRSMTLRVGHGMDAVRPPARRPTTMSPAHAWRPAPADPAARTDRCVPAAESLSARRGPRG
ncbi:hypothetical protein ACWET9_16200 [Streptomyces sp. NPDC004059]